MKTNNESRDKLNKGSIIYFVVNQHPEAIRDQSKHVWLNEKGKEKNNALPADQTMKTGLLMLLIINCLSMILKLSDWLLLWAWGLSII